MSEKRKDYITWDEYFMGVAELSAKRSKDPSTQVGACIVSGDNKILSMVTTDFRQDVPMTNFPGERKGKKKILITQNIIIQPTAS